MRRFSSAMRSSGMRYPKSAFLMGAHSNPKAKGRQRRRISLFLLESDRSLLYRAQTAPSRGWAPPVDLGGKGLRGPCLAGVDAIGRLRVVVLDEKGSLLTRREVAHGESAAWTPWAVIGEADPRSAPGAATAPGGTLEVYLVGAAPDANGTGEAAAGAAGSPVPLIRWSPPTGPRGGEPSRESAGRPGATHR